MRALRLQVFLIAMFSLFIVSGCTSNKNTTIIPFSDGVHGKEPWITNLTPKGTTLLKDIQSGHADSFGFANSDADTFELNGHHYFLAGGALYRSNLTNKGTAVHNGISDEQFGQLIKYKNKLYYSFINESALYRVHPLGLATSASTHLLFEQNFYKREILDIATGVYGNKLLFTIENRPVRWKWKYELWLADEKSDSQKELIYKFGLSARPKKLSKLFVTKETIYILAENDDEIWMTKNSAKPPKIAHLKRYWLPYGLKLNPKAIASDGENLYFGTIQGNIYKVVTGLDKPIKINQQRLPNHYYSFLKIFKNHLIYQNVKNNKQSLYQMDLESGKQLKLAISSSEF